MCCRKASLINAWLRLVVAASGSFDLPAKPREDIFIQADCDSGLSLLPSILRASGVTVPQCPLVFERDHRTGEGNALLSHILLRLCRIPLNDQPCTIVHGLKGS